MINIKNSSIERRIIMSEKIRKFLNENVEVRERDIPRIGEIAQIFEDLSLAEYKALLELYYANVTFSKINSFDIEDFKGWVLDEI
jgi:hypothetical protein